MKRSTNEQINTMMKDIDPNIFLGTLEIMKLVNMQENIAEDWMAIPLMKMLNLNLASMKVGEKYDMSREKSMIMIIRVISLRDLYRNKSRTEKEAFPVLFFD